MLTICPLIYENYLVTVLCILLKMHKSEEFKMAEVTYSLLYLDQDIRLKSECVAADHKYKRIHRGLNEDRKSLSEKSALELELDITEVQELQTVCTQPSIRNFLAPIIVQLRTMLNKIH
jgi:hypothetical protein